MQPVLQQTQEQEACIAVIYRQAAGTATASSQDVSQANSIADMQGPCSCTPQECSCGSQAPRARGPAAETSSRQRSWTGASARPSRPQAGQEAGCGDADAAVGVHRLNLAGQLDGLARDDGGLGEHGCGCRPQQHSRSVIKRNPLHRHAPAAAGLQE